MQKLFFVLLFFLVGGRGFAQQDTTASYKRFPTVPPFKLLEMDSTSVFSKSDLEKNKPALIMIFNPECEHCQHETEAIIKNIDAFKKIQIIMATTAPISQMKDFYAKYELEKFRNIKVGQDFQYMLPSFYMIHSLPYLAMYDKKGSLLTSFEGTTKIEELINVFK